MYKSNSRSTKSSSTLMEVCSDFFGNFFVNINKCMTAQARILVLALWNLESFAEKFKDAANTLIFIICASPSTLNETAGNYGGSGMRIRMCLKIMQNIPDYSLNG